LNKINLLGIILSIFQILDGIFSAIGITKFGISSEGNILLRSLMEIFGHIPELVIAKMIGIILLEIMCINVNETNRKFIMGSMIFIFHFYLIFAIIPWILVLYII